MIDVFVCCVCGTVFAAQLGGDVAPTCPACAVMSWEIRLATNEERDAFLQQLLEEARGGKAS